MSTRGSKIIFILRCYCLYISTLVPSPKPSVHCPMIQWSLKADCRCLSPEFLLPMLRECHSVAFLSGCYASVKHRMLDMPGTLSSLPLFVPLSLHYGHNTFLHLYLCHEENKAVSWVSSYPPSHPVLSVNKLPPISI